MVSKRLRGGKEWVIVRFLRQILKDGEWVPSLADLFRIIQPICDIEDKNYPYPKRGRFKTSDFLTAACKKNAKWSELEKRFEIPLRDINQSSEYRALTEREVDREIEELRQHALAELAKEKIINSARCDRCGSDDVGVEVGVDGKPKWSVCRKCERVF